MNSYKFLWANGNLEFAPAWGGTHHWHLLKRMVQDGRLPGGVMPENYVGGTISKDTFHPDLWHFGPDAWEQGEYPDKDELKYMILRQLEEGEDGGREARVRNLVHKLASPFGFFSFWYVGNPVNKLFTDGHSFHYELVDKYEALRAYIDQGLPILAGQVDDGQVSVWSDYAYELVEGEGEGGLDEEYERRFADQALLDDAVAALHKKWPTMQFKVGATVEDTEPQYNMDFLKDPQKELYPCAWEGKKMKPEAKKILKAHVLNAIETEFRNPDQWIYFTVYGSGASYNWSEEGDFDVQMWVDFNKFMELTEAEIDQDELLSNVRRLVQAVNFPSFKELNLQTEDCAGDMLIQFYPKPGTGAKEENLAQKPYACYDMETDEWIVPAHPIKPKFYGESFLLLRPKAEDIAIQAEALMDELERHTVDWQFWYAMYRKYRNPAYREQFELSRNKADEEKEGVKNLFQNVFKGRQEAYGPEGKGYLDERDLLQKLLEVWGVFQRLKHFSRAPLPWEEQDLPAEKKSGWIRVSDWDEIMEKAQRLKDGGKVHIETNTPNAVEGIVEGDHGNYETGLQRDDPESNAITLWHCSCPWGQVSWGRTRVWKKYEGRACSHLLALQWMAQDNPPAPEEQQTIPGLPGEQLPEPSPYGTIDRAPAPTGPAVPGGPNQGVPSPPPAPEPVQMQMPEPEPPPQPSHQKTIQEVSPLEIPGTFSSWRVATFNNGDIVRAKIPLWGQDSNHTDYIVPAHMAGEVLYSDEEDTVAIFSIESGPGGPHTVKVTDDTDYFYGSPQSQPFIKVKR